MRTVITKIEVGNPNGKNFQELELEVDTDSNYSALTRQMLQALGVPVDASVHSLLANGRLAMIEVGKTKIRLGGREFTTPVIFAEEGEPSLLGGIALEHALLAVDPVNKELIPVVNKRYYFPSTTTPHIMSFQYRNIAILQYANITPAGRRIPSAPPAIPVPRQPAPTCSGQ